MTEQEAIQALIDGLDSGDNEVVAEQEAVQEPQEQPQEAVEQPQQPQEQEAQEQGQINQEQAQALANLTPEQIELLNQLGLSEVGAMREQLAQIQAEQAQQAEMARQRQVFDKNLKQLNSEFPTIKAEDLGKWAEANGFLNLLSEDYNGWKAVAMAMINVAKPTNSPDTIISSSSSGTSLGAFDRIKKGESVSDVEIGADLLKSAGML